MHGLGDCAHWCCCHSGRVSGWVYVGLGGRDKRVAAASSAHLPHPRQLEPHPPSHTSEHRLATSVWPHPVGAQLFSQLVGRLLNQLAQSGRDIIEARRVPEKVGSEGEGEGRGGAQVRRDTCKGPGLNYSLPPTTTRTPQPLSTGVCTAWYAPPTQQRPARDAGCAG